jgi:hypothetical protein
LLVFTEFNLAHSVLTQYLRSGALFEAIIYGTNVRQSEKPIGTGSGPAGTDFGLDRF